MQLEDGTTAGYAGMANIEHANTHDNSHRIIALVTRFLFLPGEKVAAKEPSKFAKKKKRESVKLKKEM